MSSAWYSIFSLQLTILYKVRNPASFSMSPWVNPSTLTHTLFPLNEILVRYSGHTMDRMSFCAIVPPAMSNESPFWSTNFTGFHAQ